MAIFEETLSFRAVKTSLGCKTERFDDRLRQVLAGAKADSPERTYVVMSLKGLTDSWKARAVGVVMSVTALTGAGFNTAAADEAATENFEVDGVETVVLTENSSQVQLLPEADRPSRQWALKNPGIAVTVYVGSTPSVPHDELMTKLTADIRGVGVTDPVVFFFEANYDSPGTVVKYRHGDGTEGPHNLNTARAGAKKAASQYLWQQSDPQYAYNYGQD